MDGGDVERPRLDPEEPLHLLLQHLGARREGLNSERHGAAWSSTAPTRRRRRRRSHWRDLARQLGQPLALLLWAAAGLARVAGIAPIAVAIVIVT